MFGPSEARQRGAMRQAVTAAPSTMEWAEVVGINIRLIRKPSDLPQEALAAARKIEMRYLGGIERGQENPKVEVVRDIAKALNALPSALVAAPRGGTKVTPTAFIQSRS